MLAFLEKKNGVIKCNTIIFLFPPQKNIYHSKGATFAYVCQTLN